jgi:hypothetical protein
VPVGSALSPVRHFVQVIPILTLTVRLTVTFYSCVLQSQLVLFALLSQFTNRSAVCHMTNESRARNINSILLFLLFCFLDVTQVDESL